MSARLLAGGCDDEVATQSPRILDAYLTDADMTDGGTTDAVMTDDVMTDAESLERLRQVHHAAMRATRLAANARAWFAANALGPRAD